MSEKPYKIVESAGGIVKNRKGKIALILLNEEFEMWGYTKGKIEEGEVIIKAAMREIWEETGIKNLNLIKELGFYDRPAADGKPITVRKHMFLFESDNDLINPLFDDVAKAKWVDLDRVIDRLTMVKDKEFFQK